MVGHYCSAFDRSQMTANIEETMYFPNSDFEAEPDYSIFINYVRNIAVRKCTLTFNYTIQDEDFNDEEISLEYGFYIFSLTPRSIYIIARPDNFVNLEFSVTHVVRMSQ